MKLYPYIITMLLIATFSTACSSDPDVDVPKEVPSLSASPPQVSNVAASGANSKITVTTNQSSWSATSDNAWCKVTSKTGDGFTIVVDANSTASVRNATVTVSAGKATSVKVSVTQLGTSPMLSVSPTQVTNVAASGDNTKITVTTNQSSWSATSDNDWCKITGKTGESFTIAVDANSTTSERNATVTVSAGSATPVKISVIQLGASPTLSVSTTQVTNVAAVGGNTKITVTTNQSSWSATSDNDWCKITGKTGESFTIAVDANSTTSERNATVTVSADGATPVKISVTQLGATPALSVSPAQVTNVAASGANTKIIVTTNQSDWSATSDNTWCKVTSKTGEDFTIVVDANSSTSARNATVTVSAGSATPVKISVTQLGASPLLFVSPTQVTNVAAAGANSKITVTTNQSDWSATSDNTWCKVTSKTGEGFTITVDANSSTSSRNATVTVFAGSATPVIITVSQLGAAPALSISPVVYTVVFSASAQNEQFVYNVTTNLPSWEVKVTTPETTWCKVIKDVANNRFTITADANDSTSPRGPAIVTISAGSATPLQITVNQKAKSSQGSEDFEYGDGKKWD